MFKLVSINLKLPRYPPYCLKFKMAVATSCLQFVYIQQPWQGFKIMTKFKLTALAAILAKIQNGALFTITS